MKRKLTFEPWLELEQEIERSKFDARTRNLIFKKAITIDKQSGRLLSGESKQIAL